MTDFQKGMQKSMTESNTIPHFYIKEEIDLTTLVTSFHIKTSFLFRMDFVQNSNMMGPLSLLCLFSSKHFRWL